MCQTVQIVLLVLEVITESIGLGGEVAQRTLKTSRFPPWSLRRTAESIVATVYSVTTKCKLAVKIVQAELCAVLSTE